MSERNPYQPPAPVAEPVPVEAVPAVPAPRGQTWADVGREVIAGVQTLVSAAVYAVLIVTFGFQVARVDGLSMAPTLEDQDRLIVNKLHYRLDSPAVGDIVMLYYPRDPEKSFVKRVIGLPGDTLAVRGEVVRITKQIAYLATTISNAEGEPVSTATGTFFLRRRPQES